MKNLKHFRVLIFILSAFLVTSFDGAAQSVSLTTLGVPYNQNFDSLANSGTTNVLTINGWFLSESGTSALNNGQYSGNNGSSTAGDVYSYGSTGTGERAFGTLRSGTLIPVIGGTFTNNTGSTIVRLSISYTGEEWRCGAAGRTDALNFELSTDASSLTTGTWSGIPALNFVTPDFATTGAKDGNTAAERTALSNLILGLNILPGASFWIRWVDADPTGSDDGLSIDDFSLTPLGPCFSTLPCSIAGPTTICPNQVSLLCAAGGFQSYLWSNGATSQCNAVTAGGVYTVTATDANECIAVCSVTISQFPPPPCVITGSSTICSGNTTTLCGPFGPFTYLWNLGVTVQCLNVPVGVYTLTVTDPNGCSSTCTHTVHPPISNGCAIQGDPDICIGDSTELCAFPVGALSYAWNTGASSQCITVSTQGIYSVTVTDSNGCINQCAFTLIVHPRPVCQFTVTRSCQGGATLCGTPNMTYLWSTGETQQCIFIDSAGSFSLTITDGFGCINSCLVQVSDFPPTNCTITGNTTACNGAPATLCGPPGNQSYLWSTGAVGPCITTFSPAVYTLTVTDFFGCTASCSVTVVGNGGCLQCSNSTVVVDTNVTVNFNTNPPTYTGDQNLKTFFTYDNSGATPDKWKAIFNVGPNRLLLTNGATITVTNVPNGTNNQYAPGILIKSTCTAAFDTNTHIIVNSLNKNSGDIIIQVNGDITALGEIRNQVSGTNGLPGAISITSQCGNIFVGNTGVIQILGIDAGGNTISIVTCGSPCDPGNITINGLVKSFAHNSANNPAARPNIRVVSFNGKVTVNANTSEPLFDEFSESGGLYDIYPGLLSWTRNNVVPGKVEVQAKDTVTVRGHGTDPTGAVRKSFGAIAAIATGSDAPGGLVDVRSIEGAIVASNRAFDVSGRNRLAFNYALNRILAKGNIILSRPGATNNFNPVADASSPSIGDKGGVNLIKSFSGTVRVEAGALVSAAVPVGAGSVQGVNSLASCGGVTILGTVNPPDLFNGDDLGVCAPPAPSPIYTDCDSIGGAFRLSESIEALEQQSIKIYPNPTNSNITIEFDNSLPGKTQINLFDLSGRLMINKELDATEGLNILQLDLSDMPKGMYFVTVQNENMKEQKKIILQ